MKALLLFQYVTPTNGKEETEVLKKNILYNV